MTDPSTKLMVTPNSDPVLGVGLVLVILTPDGMDTKAVVTLSDSQVTELKTLLNLP